MLLHELNPWWTKWIKDLNARECILGTHPDDRRAYVSSVINTPEQFLQAIICGTPEDQVRAIESMVRPAAEPFRGPEIALAPEEPEQGSEVGSVVSQGPKRVRVAEGGGDPRYTAPDAATVEEIAPPMEGAAARIQSPYGGTQGAWEMAYSRHDDRWSYVKRASPTLAGLG